MDEPCLCYCRGSASLLRSWQDMKVRKCTMCSYWKVPLLCIHAHIAYSITSSCVNRIGQGDSAVRLSTTVTMLYNWVVWAFMLLIQGGHTEQASLLYTVLSFTSISCQVLLTLARRPSVQITGQGYLTHSKRCNMRVTISHKTTDWQQMGFEPATLWLVDDQPDLLSYSWLTSNSRCYSNTSPGRFSDGRLVLASKVWITLKHVNSPGSRLSRPHPGAWSWGQLHVSILLWTLRPQKGHELLVQYGLGSDTCGIISGSS